MAAAQASSASRRAGPERGAAQWARISGGLGVPVGVRGQGRGSSRREGVPELRARGTIDECVAACTKAPEVGRPRHGERRTAGGAKGHLAGRRRQLAALGGTAAAVGTAFRCVRPLHTVGAMAQAPPNLGQWWRRPRQAACRSRHAVPGGSAASWLPPWPRWPAPRQSCWQCAFVAARHATRTLPAACPTLLP